jgi:hypothetical protein
MRQLIEGVDLALVSRAQTFTRSAGCFHEQSIVASRYGLSTHCARNACVRALPSTYAPTMSPDALIPKTRVAVAPGMSTLLKV